MARGFHRRERLGAISEINVTPLIDLAFALLIIFMITTPLLEQSIDLSLPSESQKPQTPFDGRDYQTIAIDAAGKVFWGDREVSLEEIDELLEGLASDRNPPVVNIRADFRLQYQAVVSVLDLVTGNNLSRISLDTRVK